MNQLIKSYLEDNIEGLSYEARNYYRDLQYYVGAINIKQRLIDTLKLRSKYKRALKEYKKQCRQIELQKYEKIIEKYKEYTDKFIEDMYGYKLSPYYKIMLKMMRGRMR